MVAAAVLGAVACGIDEGGGPSVDSGVLVNDAVSEMAPEAASGDAASSDAAGADGDDATPAFTPASITGVELWLSASQGVMIDGGDVLEWVDQSGKNDPLRNVFPGAFGAPTVIDAGFGPAVSFNDGQGLRTGKWDAGLTIPISVFVVAGKDPIIPNPPREAYLFDSFDLNARLVVLAGQDGLLREFAGAFGTPAVGSFSKPMTVVAVFNGVSSFLLLSANRGDSGSSTPGTNNTTMGFTIGNYWANGYAFRGYIAEFVAYSKALSDQEIAALNAYAAKKYGVVIQ